MGKRDSGTNGSRAGRILHRALEVLRRRNARKRQPPVCAPESSLRLHDGCTHACPSGCILPPDGCPYMKQPEAYENRCALCLCCTNRHLENPGCGAPGIVKKNSCCCNGRTEAENPWE